MIYEAQFTLEGGAKIQASSVKEAKQKAQKEAERQYGRIVASEMYIELEESYKND